jgi:ABC-2 type transport system permease protein
MTNAFALNARAYGVEIKYEFLKRLRLRAYTFSTLAFPAMFYLFFGTMNRNAHIGSVGAAKYILVSYSVFGLLGAALFGFGVSLAIERGEGWLELKQASPMPPFAYVLAKLANCLVFSLVILATLLALGVTIDGVRFGAMELVKLALILLAGTVPFAALGMLIGFVAPSSSAAGIVNMIYLPLSFCSGLWIPVQFLPRIFQKIAPALPSYHLAQLAQATIGAAAPGSNWVHWNVLIGFTLICLGVARWLMYRGRV